MRRNHGTTKKRLIIAVAFLLAMIACTVAFAEGEEAGSNLYGTFWSLLPPIIAIGLALITKEVYTSLFVGIVVGCVLQNITPNGFSLEHSVTGIFEMMTAKQTKALNNIWLECRHPDFPCDLGHYGQLDEQGGRFGFFRQVGCEQNQDPCGRAACNGRAWLLDFH